GRVAATGLARPPATDARPRDRRGRRRALGAGRVAVRPAARLSLGAATGTDAAGTGATGGPTGAAGTDAHVGVAAGAAHAGVLRRATGLTSHPAAGAEAGRGVAVGIRRGARAV